MPISFIYVCLPNTTAQKLFLHCFFVLRYKCTEIILTVGGPSVCFVTLGVYCVKCYE